MKPGPSECAADDQPDGVRTQFDARRVIAKENLPAWAVRATVPKVQGNRSADIREQGQALIDSSLSAHEEFAGSPAQVRDLHRSDLTGAHAEAREQ
jgi:hypothetical protein